MYNLLIKNIENRGLFLVFYIRLIGVIIFDFLLMG